MRSIWNILLKFLNHKKGSDFKLNCAAKDHRILVIYTGLIMKNIGIVGYNGHFGKVIAGKLIASFPNVHFTLLGRRGSTINHGNVSFSFFDFNTDSVLPRVNLPYSLIVDLSGPTQETDGKLFEICARSKVPCLDMAIHNSHIKRISGIQKRFPDSVALVHFGFFPGLSNLILTEGFKLTGKKEAILANEFPAYAGGGKNVSRSLLDLLDGSAQQFNIINNKIVQFRMHSEKKKFSWNGVSKVFYRWEYPEVNSILYSNEDVVTVERFFRVKPAILNPLFQMMTLYWQTSLARITGPMFASLVHLAKSSIFSKMDPGVEMKLFDTNQNELLGLTVKSAVSFHGLVMARFLAAVLEKNFEPGVYTPEQICSLSDILKQGDHQSYSLVYKVNSGEAGSGNSLEPEIPPARIP